MAGTLDYHATTAEPFLLENGEYALTQGILRPGDTVRSHLLSGFHIAVSNIFWDVK